MGNLMKIALLASVISGAAMADESKTVEQSFSVNSGASFTLENINGRVDLALGANDVIEVVAVATAKNDEDLERIDIVMQQSGNDVVVATEYKQKSWGRNNNSGGVEYTVKLPANMGKTKVELVNGSLKIEDIAGKIDADLVNGSVEVNGASGNGKFDSVNGSITLTYHELVNVNYIDAETVNGSIKVYLPSNPDIAVDAETMHGSIKSDFGMSAKKGMFAGRSMKGSVGSGQTKLTLESVNGSIKVMSK